MFGSKWSNVVADWCVQFYRQYGQSPGKEVEVLFESWSEKAPDDQVTLVERFLSGLSDDYEDSRDVNVQLLLDQSESYFHRVNLTRLQEAIQSNLDQGRTEDAQKAVSTFRQVPLSSSSGIDVLSDQEALRSSFESASESLVDYPGDLDVFTGDD